MGQGSLGSNPDQVFLLTGEAPFLAPQSRREGLQVSGEGGGAGAQLEARRHPGTVEGKGGGQVSNPSCRRVHSLQSSGLSSLNTVQPYWRLSSFQGCQLGDLLGHHYNNLHPVTRFQAQLWVESPCYTLAFWGVSNLHCHRS